MFALFTTLTLTVPPAAKVLAIVAIVYPLIQGLKKIPTLTPYIQGWWAVGLNVVLSALGLLITVPSDQLYTTNTALALLTVILSAAGVHGTVSSLTAQATTAVKP
jgi:hypothetical protein